MDQKQLFQHQIRMAHQIARLSSKLLKQNQARLLCNSIKTMLARKLK